MRPRAMWAWSAARAVVYEVGSLVGLRVIDSDRAERDRDRDLNRAAELEREREVEALRRVELDTGAHQREAELRQRAEVAEAHLAGARKALDGLMGARGVQSAKLIAAVLAFTKGTTVDIGIDGDDNGGLYATAYHMPLGRFEGRGRTVDAALVALARAICDDGDKRGQDFVGRVESLRAAIAPATDAPKGVA